MEYVMERTGLADLGRRAFTNLTGIELDPALSPRERAQLAAIREQLGHFTEELQDQQRSDAEVRSRLARVRDEIQEMNVRIADIESRLVAVEQEQQRQLRLMVDMQGRVAQLEQDVVAIRSDVDEIQDILFPDPNKFLRHEGYLSLGAMYANSPALQNEAEIGFTISGQFNVNRYFGLFADALMTPLTASDVSGMPQGSSVSWETTNVQVGAVINPLPPRSWLSVQLGGGGGFAHNRLLYFAPGIDSSEDEDAQELGKNSNIYAVAKAEVGVAPPAFSLEPVVGFGYLTFLEDVAYQNEAVSSNLGRDIWYLTLGIRMRHYLRGKDSATE